MRVGDQAGPLGSAFYFQKNQQDAGIHPRIPLGSAEKSGKKRHKGDTDEGDTSASHQLYYSIFVVTLL